MAPLQDMTHNPRERSSLILPRSKWHIWSAIAQALSRGQDRNGVMEEALDQQAAAWLAGASTEQRERYEKALAAIEKELSSAEPAPKGRGAKPKK